MPDKLWIWDGNESFLTLNNLTNDSQSYKLVVSEPFVLSGQLNGSLMYGEDGRFSLKYDPNKDRRKDSDLEVVTATTTADIPVPSAEMGFLSVIDGDNCVLSTILCGLDGPLVGCDRPQEENIVFGACAVEQARSISVEFTNRTDMKLRCVARIGDQPVESNTLTVGPWTVTKLPFLAPYRSVTLRVSFCSEVSGMFNERISVEYCSPYDGHFLFPHCLLARMRSSACF